MDCGENPHLGWMATRTVWAEVFENYKAGFICPACFEKRLGRKLVPNDIDPVPLSFAFLKLIGGIMNRFRVELTGVSINSSLADMLDELDGNGNGVYLAEDLDDLMEFLRDTLPQMDRSFKTLEIKPWM